MSKRTYIGDVQRKECARKNTLSDARLNALVVVVQILKNFNGSPSTDCPPCARVHDQASGGGEDDEEEQEGEEPG